MIFVTGRYRRTSGSSVPSHAHSTPNTPHAGQPTSASAATTPSSHHHQQVAYAVYHNGAMTATASQGEIYHSSSTGRWRYRSARGASAAKPAAYAFQTSAAPVRRSSHGDLSSSEPGAGMFAGDCGGGFRYSSTEDLFEQAANRSRANSRQNSRQNSMTDLTASPAAVYGSNSAMRQRFLFGGTGSAATTPSSQQHQTPVYVNSGGHALSLGAAFDLKAATEQLQLRTNELKMVEGRTVVGQASEGGRKKKFGEWAI